MYQIPLNFQSKWIIPTISNILCQARSSHLRRSKTIITLDIFCDYLTLLLIGIHEDWRTTYSLRPIRYVPNHQQSVSNYLHLLQISSWNARRDVPAQWLEHHVTCNYSVSYSYSASYNCSVCQLQLLCLSATTALPATVTLSATV